MPVPIALVPPSITTYNDEVSKALWLGSKTPQTEALREQHVEEHDAWKCCKEAYLLAEALERRLADCQKDMRERTRGM